MSDDVAGERLELLVLGDEVGLGRDLDHRALGRRDEKPEPVAGGQLGADEPMPEWERDLLQGSTAAGEAPEQTA